MIIGLSGKKGDVVWFNWRHVPHATANCGYAPRDVLKISGTSSFIDQVLDNCEQFYLDSL